jgi:hypothetical protein
MTPEWLMAGSFAVMCVGFFVYMAVFLVMVLKD